MKRKVFALLLGATLLGGLIGTAFAGTIWVDDGEGGLRLEYVDDDVPSTNPDPGPSTDPGPGPSIDPGPGPSTDPGPGPSADPDPSPSANPNPGPSTRPDPGPSNYDPDPGPSSSSPSSTNLPVSTGTNSQGGASTTETTAVPTATTQNGQASTTVDKAMGDEIVKQAVANKSDNVVIAPTITGEVTKANVSISVSTVASLASSTDASLTVDTPVATVTIPNSTLASLGAGSGTLAVNVSVGIELTVTVDVQKNGQSVDELPAPMKVNAPVSDQTAQSGAGLVAVKVNADGSETVLPKSTLDSNGEMSVLLDTGSGTIKFEDRSKSFIDMGGHWASDSVDFASSHGLFQGVSNNEFGPNTHTSRAMMVTVLHRLESTPAASGISFDDVPTSAYYAQAASWAANMGITTGTGGGFSGDSDISREMMVTMLYRYVQKTAPGAGSIGNYAGMTGADQVSSWASDAMNWAVGSGIIRGDGSGLRPGDPTSRAEMAAVMQRLVGLITK